MKLAGEGRHGSRAGGAGGHLLARRAATVPQVAVHHRRRGLRRPHLVGSRQAGLQQRQIFLHVGHLRWPCHSRRGPEE